MLHDPRFRGCTRCLWPLLPPRPIRSTARTRRGTIDKTIINNINIFDIITNMSQQTCTGPPPIGSAAKRQTFLLTRYRILPTCSLLRLSLFRTRTKILSAHLIIFLYPYRFLDSLIFGDGHFIRQKEVQPKSPFCLGGNLLKSFIQHN